MIGNWNEDNCILALAPYAWSLGNGNVSFNVGNMPSFPAGAYQPCALINMLAGFGYRTDLGALRYDGNDDLVQTALNIAHTNASTFSAEFWINWHGAEGAGVRRTLFGAYDDANHFYYAYIDAFAETMVFYFRNVAIDLATSNTTLVAGVNHIVCVKDDANPLGVFINGAEVVYGVQNAYGLGAYALVQNMAFGAYPVSLAFRFINEMYWSAIYDVALTPARILANYNLGANMEGMLGNNVGNVMGLSMPVPPPSLNCCEIRNEAVEQYKIFNESF